jgi:hypothetical protein
VRIKRSLSAIIATIFIAAVPLAASAQFSVGVGFTVGTPPPPLPVYSMPPAPYPNYMWTPGYWAWGPAGYYWVPGTWVAPPSVGLYWTPGYWGYASGGYGWNAGYWGPTVGFYGGVNYGFGYYGAGFVGGFWSGGAFNYNTAVVNVNRSVVHNTYINKTVINKNVNCGNNCHVSYNGGHGGVTAKPTSAQLTARQGGVTATADQRRQAQIAGQDRNLYANVNHGKPPVTSSQKAFSSTSQIPHSAPVTAADRTKGQSQVVHGSTGSTGHAVPANPAPAHQAPVSAHHATQPAPASHSNQTTATHHHPSSGTMQSHSNSMYGQKHPSSHPPQHGTMQGHPNGGHPPSGNHPPSGSNNNNKNKPPRR